MKMKAYRQIAQSIASTAMLILAVVALAGLDTVICCAACSHLAWETHSASCCHHDEESSHPPVNDAEQAEFLGSAGACHPCVNIPLLQGIHDPDLDHGGPAIAGSGASLPAGLCLIAPVSRRGFMPTIPPPFLEHLRSTTLLI